MMRKLLDTSLMVMLLAGCAPAVNPQPAATAAPAATVQASPTVAPVPPAQVQKQTMGAATYTDGLGRKVTLAQPAQRVVSLAPSNTEILFAIGAGAQVVGRDSFSDYPTEAKNVPDIGGSLSTLNAEVILSKQPELVLATPLTAPEQVAELAKAGLTVYVLPNPKTFEDLYANLETVGKLTGHENEAAGLVASLKARVEAVAGKVGNVTTRPIVYYELDSTDPSAPYTSGPDTFIDLIIREAGGENFGTNLKGEWVQISIEELLSRQPDMILLGDSLYGGVTADMVKTRAGWDALNAVKQGKIYAFDDNLVSRPGPRLVDGLESIAHLLHPDLFP
jgi:iron complex transport system substrate-binding protein